MNILNAGKRFFMRARLERQLEAELQFHIERQAADNQAAGMGAAEARRQAQLSFGAPDRFREECRDARGAAWAEAGWGDLRFGLRLLRRGPGFAAVAVLTLALGIGAATAMFSVVNAVLINTSPFPDPARLVQVSAAARLNGRPVRFINAPVEAFEAIRQSGVFPRVAIAGFENKTLYLDGIAEDAALSRASPGLFATLGITPALGRSLSGEGHEILLANQLWRQRFHSNPRAVGRTVRLDDQLYTVVGVLPPDVDFPQGREESWISGLPAPRDTGIIVGRLPSGGDAQRSLAEARAAVATIGKRLASQGELGRMAGLEVGPLRRSLAPRTARLALLTLLAAVGLLLLIACANAASLLLARGIGRQREFAVRRALGASRGRLARQLLTEALWLAIAGGGLGWVLALGTMRLVRLGPAAIPRLQAARLDPRVLAFAVCISVLSGLACGLAPAWRCSNPDVQGGFQGGPLTTRQRRGGGALLVAEIALTLVLLIGAALMLHSFANLLAVDPGFNPHRVLAFDVIAPRQPQSTQHDIWQRRSLMDQAALARIRALPGVAAASYADSLPFEGANWGDFSRPGGNAPAVRADVIEVGPGFFPALDAPLLRGSYFATADLVLPEAAFHSSGPPPPPQPVFVNQSLARLLWPDRDALGQAMRGGDGTDRYQVIGVVADMRYVALADRGRPQVYVPMPGNYNDATFLVRSALPPAALMPAVRRALSVTDASLSLGEPEPLDQALAASLAEPRFRTLLLGVFAGLALALALIGLYGTLAYHVQQRTREIGVRLALGAGRGAVLRMILGESLTVLGAGIALGGLLAWGLTRYMASLLFGLSPLDAPTWLAAAAALLAAGLLASYLPARRATRVDPVEALRCE